MNGRFETAFGAYGDRKGTPKLFLPAIAAVSIITAETMPSSPPIHAAVTTAILKYAAAICSE